MVKVFERVRQVSGVRNMYSFIRIEKFKGDARRGVLEEAQRTPELHYERRKNYSNDIDWTKTHKNVQLVNSTVGQVNSVMRAQGVKLRNKNSVGLVGAIIGASPGFFNKDENGDFVFDEKARAFGEDAKGLIIEQLCGGDASRLVSFVAHLDEGNLHFHALVVPIVENEQGERKLSAKALLNGRQRMRDIQDRAFEFIGKPRGLERGELLDLTKPAQEQKRHKKTDKYREEKAQAALDKIIKAAEHLDKEDVELLKDLKDAAFGRGKILPTDKHQRANDIIKTLEALPEALDALRELRNLADRNGRIKTLEGRLQRGNALARDWNRELQHLRPIEAEAQAFGQLLQRLRTSPERSFLDMWQLAKRLSTHDGEVNYSQVPDQFIRLYHNAKQQREHSHIFHSYTQDHDDHDGPILGGEE